MTPLYKITNWETHYENSLSRKYKHLGWIPLTNKHDGEGYLLLAERPDFAEIFSAWILILQIASKCTPRGTLIKDDGTPHSPKSLALKTRLPESIFIKALPVLVSVPKWLSMEDSSTVVDAEGSERKKERTERTEQNAPPLLDTAEPDDPEPAILKQAAELCTLYIQQTGKRGGAASITTHFHDLLISADNKLDFEAWKKKIEGIPWGNGPAKVWDFTDQFLPKKNKGKDACPVNAPSKAKTPGELEADAQRLIEHSRRQEEEAEARRKQRDGQGADPKIEELKNRLKGAKE